MANLNLSIIFNTEHCNYRSMLLSWQQKKKSPSQNWNNYKASRSKCVCRIHPTENICSDLFFDECHFSIIKQLFSLSDFEKYFISVTVDITETLTVRMTFRSGHCLGIWLTFHLFWNGFTFITVDINGLRSTEFIFCFVCCEEFWQVY